MRARGWWVLLVALATTACGDQNKAPPLDWTLHSTVTDENLDVVEGVQLCAYGHSDIPCATTDAKGIVDLALPSGKELLVSYEKQDFVTKLREVSTTGPAPKGLGGWMFQRRSWYDQVLAKVGGTGALDLQTKGAVSVETHHGGAGLKFGLKRLDGQLVDKPVGPIYVCVVNYAPHLVICNGGSTNGDDRGLAVFLNVAPGNYEVDIDTSGSAKGSNIECTPPGFKCDGAQTNCITVPVFAGMISHAGGIVCQ